MKIYAEEWFEGPNLLQYYIGEPLKYREGIKSPSGRFNEEWVTMVTYVGTFYPYENNRSANLKNVIFVLETKKARQLAIVNQVFFEAMLKENRKYTKFYTLSPEPISVILERIKKV